MTYGYDAPVDVAHRAELALEQDPLAALECLVDERLPVDDVATQALRGAQIVGGDPIRVGRLIDPASESGVDAAMGLDDARAPSGSAASRRARKMSGSMRSTMRIPRRATLST